MAHHVSSPPPGSIELDKGHLRVTANSDAQARLMAKMCATYTNNQVEGTAQGAVLHDQELAQKCNAMKQIRVLYRLDDTHQQGENTWHVTYTAYAFDDVNGTIKN
jgi:hypothetical protein